MPETRRAAFRALGYNQHRPFFPHRFYVIPKAGPDALQLASAMCGIRDPDALWEVVLFARGPVLEEFPPSLFFHDDVVWHRQHLGKPGHIAYACLALRGKELFGLNYVSDVVQRIGRAREFKTRIENRFKGWPHLLLNSILSFALQRGIARVYSPSAALVLKHTDPARVVRTPLFERIYNRAVVDLYRPLRDGPWWLMDVAETGDRVVMPDWGEEPLPTEKTICVCHDIERGLGHVDREPAFAARADRFAPGALADMLAIERALNVAATYHVLGCLLADVRAPIGRDGHCLAFHSFDHRLNARQLRRCREVDYRLEGYRAPRSHLTRELSDRNLCRHNFQWLAAAPDALGTATPRVDHRVVKIPIAFDDYPLHARGMPYEEWERLALHTVAQQQFVAFALHDCYASHWLPAYRDFLQKLQGLGCFRTLDGVSRDLLLSGCA